MLGHWGLGEEIWAGAPGAVGGSVGAGDYNGVVIGVAHPALPVIGAAVAVGRIAMAGQNELDAHFGGALHDGVKVIDLEPEQHAIAVGLGGWIANWAVMMFDVKTVQLQDETAIFHELLIVAAAVRAAAA